MNLTRLFVYGTLRRGESNHFLLSAATFVGVARTRPRYRLLDLGDHPAMQEGGSTAVHGELYDVDTATLQRLDALEEHPDVYARRPCDLEVATPEPSSVQHGGGVRRPCDLVGGGQASAYFLVVPPPAEARSIPGGDWCRR